MIYHYTKGENIPKILNIRDRKIHLWFTRSDCLNDTSEGNELLRVIIEVAENHIKAGDISQDTLSEIKKQYNSTKNGGIFFVNDGCDKEGREMFKSLSCNMHAYICSFSSDKDSLDLWRYYSKGDIGYSLGFNENLLENSLKEQIGYGDENLHICKVDFEKVIYKDQEKTDIVENLFQKCQKISTKEIFAPNFCVMVNKYRFIFKHKCFSSEKEIRCVIYLPADKKIFQEYNADTFDVNYRVQNGEIIPYLNIEFNQAAFWSVMLSPFASDSAVKLMKEYYDDFFEKRTSEGHINKSKLPIRF